MDPVEYNESFHWCFRTQQQPTDIQNWGGMASVPMFYLFKHPKLDKLTAKKKQDESHEILKVYVLSVCFCFSSFVFLMRHGRVMK